MSDPHAPSWELRPHASGTRDMPKIFAAVTRARCVDSSRDEEGPAALEVTSHLAASFFLFIRVQPRVCRDSEREVLREQLPYAPCSHAEARSSDATQGLPFCLPHAMRMPARDGALDSTE